MPDATYQPKVYTKQGGEELVVASGGTLTIETGGTLTVPAGTVAANTLAFTGATGDNIISIPDNLASALVIKEAGNAYLTCVSTNGSEAITVAKNTTFSGTATVTGNVTLSAAHTASVGASTAAAGTVTGDAGALPAGTATIYPTTAADDTKGVVIDVADKVTGRMLLIGNGVSNKILKVYPPAGGTINGAAADAAFSSASGKGVIIVCLSSAGNTWLAW